MKGREFLEYLSDLAFQEGLSSMELVSFEVYWFWDMGEFIPHLE
jgi:hypothetical protein